MANLTIAIEDDLLRKARVHALEQGTSVNALVREYLRELAGEASRQLAAARRIVKLAHENDARVGGATWARDDLHERESL